MSAGFEKKNGKKKKKKEAKSGKFRSKWAADYYGMRKPVANSNK